MLRKGTLHAYEPEALEDGTYRAVTLINRPPHGVMVWAGKIAPTAIGKSAADILLSDYMEAEKVSFSQWPDVWEYFAPREYASLTQTLRKEVELLYPGE